MPTAMASLIRVGLDWTLGGSEVSHYFLAQGKCGSVGVASSCPRGSLAGGVGHKTNQFREVNTLWSQLWLKKYRKWEELADKSYSLRHLLIWDTLNVTECPAVIYFVKLWWTWGHTTLHLLSLFPCFTSLFHSFLPPSNCSFQKMFRL